MLFASRTRTVTACLALAAMIAGTFATLSYLEAQTAPASAPATKAATETPPETYTVKTGTIDLRVDLDATFAPAAAQEVRIRTKAPQADLQIVSIATEGQVVKAGDVLLEADTRQLRRQLSQVENELVTAKANLAKAEADAALGSATDNMVLKRAERAARRATEALAWWDKTDNKQMSLYVTLNEKMDAFYIENATDELAQLKKMYKSEDLHNESADIVMKRAEKILDLYKLMGESGNLYSQRVREYDMKRMRDELMFFIEDASLAEKQAATTVKQQQVTRITAAKAAQLAIDNAEDRIADIKKDLEAMRIVATGEGRVTYGSFRNKNWNLPPEAPKVGDRVQPNQVVLTVWSATALKAIAELPESRLATLPIGTKLRLSPIAFSEVSYEAVVESINITPAGRGAEPTYDVHLTLPETDSRLAPGFKALAATSPGKLENVIIVPVSAVSRGRVWVKTGEGADAIEVRDVVVGRSDGTHTEIRKGLAAGDIILKQAKR